MAGVVLATGIVELIPSLRGSQARIQQVRSKVDTGKVGQQLGKNLGNGVAGAFRRIAAPAIAAAAGIGIKQLAGDAVGAYSELEDSTAAAGVIFGKEMKGIVSLSKGAARELGLTQQQVINAANTYGTYGKAAGLAGQDLATFSTDFTKLAADLASFKGTSTEQAIEAIGSGLRGEAEPLRAYGVLLDDATMRQKALELGIISSTKDALTPQQKILASQALIFEQTADAQGDYARTSQSTANIEKTRAALAENLAAKMGQVLAPAFTAVRVRSIAAMTGVDGLLDRVIAFQTGLASGALTPDLVRALGLDPDQGFGYAVGEGIGGLRAFSAAWKANDGDVTSSGFPGWMEKTAYTIRQGVDDIRSAGSDLIGGDWSAVGPLFDSVLAVARPAGPLLMELGGAVGSVSGELGELAGSALPLVVPLLEGATGVMNYLAENSWALSAAVGALAIGWGAYKVAQAAANVGQLLAVPATVANAAANWQLAAAIRAANTSSAVQVSASKKTGLAMFGQAAVTGGAAATTGVYAGAATGASVATRLLGAAVRALPFVGLAALIAGAVAGLIWFFTETEAGQEIVGNVWNFIQGAVGGVVDWFTGTALPAVGGVLSSIGGFFTGLYNDHVLPVTSGISTVVGGVVTWFQTSVAPPLGAVIGGIGGFFSGLYNGVIVPVFGGIATVIGGFWLFFRGIFQVVRSLLVNIIGPAFLNFWNGVIAPVFTWIGDKIGQWWTAAGIIFGLAVAFVRNTLGGVFTWFRDSIISPVFNFIGGVIDTQVRGWTIVFGVAGDFLRTTLGPAFTWLRDNVIDPVFDGISGTIDTVWRTGIKPVFDTIADVVENKLPEAFEGGIGFIEDIWGGLLEVLKTPVRFVVNDVINGGIIKAFNTVAGWLPDVDPLPDVALPRGFYHGGRTGGRPDEVRGVVHGQEVVVPHKATAAIDQSHPGLLDELVSGRVPQHLGNPASAGYLWTPFQDQIRRSGILSLQSIGNHAGNAAWAPASAASAWNGITGGLNVQIGTQKGARGYYSAVGNSPYFNPNTLGYAWAHSGGIILNAAQPTSPAMRRAVMIHEIGHVLGLPHTNAASIMQPVLGNYYNPTAYDFGQIRGLYGGAAGTATPAAAGDDGGGFVDWIADLFNVDDLLGKIAGAGFFIDLLKGVGRKLIDVVVDAVTGLFGGGATAPGGLPAGGTGVAPMLFDGGGFLPYTGEDAIAVQHKRRDPDAVLTGNQWRDVRAIVADRAESGDRMENNFYGADFDQATEIVEQINYSVKRKRRGGANNRRRIPA